MNPVRWPDYSLARAWGLLIAHSALAADFPVAPAKVYLVTRSILELRLDDHTFKARHDEVSGYMPAMTMPFTVTHRNELAGFHPGDRVRFQLCVTEEGSWAPAILRLAPDANAVAPPDADIAARQPRPAYPLMSFAFTNELGAPVRLEDFRGRALAITFFFSRCPIPDYCPRLMKNIEAASRQLAALPNLPTNWHFLAVTFDLEYDTPAVLKAYGKRFGQDPRHWSFLTGPLPQIAELARLSDVQSTPGKEGFFDHDFRALIIDPQGELQMAFPVGGDLSESIVSEIRKALSVAGDSR